MSNIVAFFRYSSSSIYYHHLRGGIPMKKQSKPRVSILLTIYDSLTPENRARLVALLKELVQSQATVSDSHLTTKKKVP